MPVWVDEFIGLSLLFRKAKISSVADHARDDTSFARSNYTKLADVASRAPRTSVKHCQPDQPSTPCQWYSCGDEPQATVAGPRLDCSLRILLHSYMLSNLLQVQDMFSADSDGASSSCGLGLLTRLSTTSTRSCCREASTWKPCIPRSIFQPSSHSPGLRCRCAPPLMLITRALLLAVRLPRFGSAQRAGLVV